MRYVIIRDDDTNALTPVECLERLYRPFLNRGLPVNLAVIPDVATNVRMAGGQPEGFLLAKNGTNTPTVPITANPGLVRYLQQNPGYRIVQHGCHHDHFEFDSPAAGEMARRLDHGMRLLLEAGFPQPKTFVAPYDKLSRASLREVARRYRVLSTGWFEWRRLPVSWLPKYAWMKARRTPHWSVGQTALLSHPGCLLSCNRNYHVMLDQVMESIHTRQLTVLVTHWWEYFRDGRADETFIHVLHRTADYLATRPDVKVVSFSDLAERGVKLN